MKWGIIGMCNKLSYQLLVSTMHQNNFNIYDQMNLNSDVIIVNQHNYNKCESITKDDNNIVMYSFNERGIGLSRNTAMMRSTADILEFADDDMIFVDDYKDKVIREFENHPEADAILFSLESLNKERPLLKIKSFSRVNKFTALKYGCARLAIRREKALYNNLSFSLLFGGGAKYGSGEDTVFLQDCIRAGLKIYCSPIKVADVRQETSTWFDGYTEKYYLDKGALFAAALPKLCYIYALISVIKLHSNNFSKIDILKLYIQGIRLFKNYQKRKLRS